MRTEATPERIAKLPQWAQDELERLRHRVEHLEADLAVGPEDSDTFVEGWTITPDRPLGDRPSIRFHLAGGFIISVRLDADREHIEVMSGGRRVGVLAIQPRAANLAWIRAED